MPQSPYRPEFEAALRLFARMSQEMAESGHARPILVGGAAAEYYTQSALSTGDFDLCTPRQERFEATTGAGSADPRCGGAR